MSAEISPRQKVLTKIWGSRGPDELLEIMAGESAARDRDIATELRSQSEACATLNRDLAGRLWHMA